MICISCGSGQLRKSKVRLTDIPHLLLLKFPARCRICDVRRFVWFGAFRHLLPHESNKGHPAGHNE